MTDDNQEAIDDAERPRDRTQLAQTNYKVLGQIDDDDGVGILGQNDASSGTPVAVKGTVPNAPFSGYGLYTPHEAKIGGALEVFNLIGSNIVNANNINGEAVGNDELNSAAVGTLKIQSGAVTSDKIKDGTIDTADIAANGASDGHVLRYSGFDWKTGFPGTVGSNEPFELLAGGNTALRLEPNGAFRTNVIAGTDSNQVLDDSQAATISGGDQNDVADSYGVVGGGYKNTAGVDDDTDTTANYATVGGGFDNVASGSQSTVPGGTGNVASGQGSFAAGTNAKAADFNAFVWNDGSLYHDFGSDGTDDGFSSAKDVAGSGVAGADTFNVSASGGARIVTGGSLVTYISGNSSGWANNSSRAVKTDVEPVEPEAVLDGVEEMDVATWTYDTDGEDEGPRHIGPMAEDFHGELDADVGDSEDHINSIDADGVALAAIQGLSERLEETRAELDEARTELEERDRRIERLDAENEELRDRLAALEERVADPDDGE